MNLCTLRPAALIEALKRETLLTNSIQSYALVHSKGQSPSINLGIRVILFGLLSLRPSYVAPMLEHPDDADAGGAFSFHQRN